jgi:Na+/phosphate symporter
LKTFCLSIHKISDIIGKCKYLLVEKKERKNKIKEEKIESICPEFQVLYVLQLIRNRDLVKAIVFHQL